LRWHLGGVESVMGRVVLGGDAGRVGGW
jgi:hypothetical protein